jgi:hypothetical protein
VRDFLKGKRCMVWSFMGNARMYEALRDYGDRFDTVGIFTFEVDATGTITETGTSISSMLPYIQKWPHIKWLLTIMNHGIANIFTALRNNENGAIQLRLFQPWSLFWPEVRRASFPLFRQEGWREQSRRLCQKAR